MTTNLTADTLPATAAVNIAALTRPFPPEAIKSRKGGGGKELRYVEAFTVIRRLNEATGFNWSFSVLNQSQDGDVLKAHVCLTIPGLGSREHIGVQKVAPNGGEDLLKGAISDALKKAATLFGIGLELYGDDYEAEAAEVQRLAEERRQRDREARQPATAVAPEVKRAAAGFVTEARRLGVQVFKENGEPDPRQCLTVAGDMLGMTERPRELTADQWARATTLLADRYDLSRETTEEKAARMLRQQKADADAYNAAQAAKDGISVPAPAVAAVTQQDGNGGMFGADPSTLPARPDTNPMRGGI